MKGEDMGQGSGKGENGNKENKYRSEGQGAHL